MPEVLVERDGAPNRRGLPGGLERGMNSERKGTGTRQALRFGLSRILFILALLDGVFMLYLAWTGFPAEFSGALRLKDMSKPFRLLVLLLAAGWILHPEKKWRQAGWDRAEALLSKPGAVWVLAALYALLFLWEQVTEYLAIDINFIPFGFYDYMLHYLFQGKVNYTGLLHGFYHFNHILILLAPLWYVFRNSLFLVLIYGPIAALAAVPLAHAVREKIREPFAAFFVAFVYLNYRYFHNLLEVNFAVEIFYPLFLFGAFASALKGKWFFYYASVILGLTVKEDSFLYFSAVGLFVLTQKGKRQHGFWSLALAGIYLLLIVKVIAPLSGSDILSEDMENFVPESGPSSGALGEFVAQPWRMLAVLWDSEAKRKIWGKLLGRLLFLPVATPAIVLVTVPLFPLFLRGDKPFVDLLLHYSAPLISFVFMALVLGLTNVTRRVPEKYRRAWLWAVCLILVLVNGGHYAPRRIEAENLESIRWARRIPREANLVTHGHLLPYVGYRKYNYYFALPFDSEKHVTHEAYANADYFLIDLNVNLYPLDESYFREKIDQLSTDPRYELAADGRRYLFRRKG
jgi:uncharacterized membrane protein